MFTLCYGLLSCFSVSGVLTYRFNIQHYCCSWVYATWLSGVTMAGLSPASTCQLSWAHNAEGAKVRRVFLCGDSNSTRLANNSPPVNATVCPRMTETPAHLFVNELMLRSIVSEKGVTPYFMPKTNVTLRSKGFTGWRPMLGSLYNNPQNWLEQYHMRSISETVNSMIKIRFGDRITRRLDYRKKTQTFLKQVAHNVRRMGYLKILYNIQFSKAQGCG